jgi:hypothetical protein
MVEASFCCNYYFLDKQRSYLENIKLYSLLETNFNFKGVSKYPKSECSKLINNNYNDNSNCLNYILKLKIVLEISIFLLKKYLYV